MPIANIFFNRRECRSLGFSEQLIEYLAALGDRTGGSVTPDQDLGEINDTVTGLESANRTLRSKIRKLERRINELENAQ